MEYPQNKTQLIRVFESQPNEIKSYFGQSPELIKNFSWDVSISYIFSRIEIVKRTSLYCGLVKIHWTQPALTRSLLDKEHITRARFKDLFRVIFDKQISPEILAKLSRAEAIRDKVAHGKSLTQAEARQCIADALGFANDYSYFMLETLGSSPFADLRGFKGRAEPLTKETTRWVLRGMGIPPVSRKEKEDII